MKKAQHRSPRSAGTRHAAASVRPPQDLDALARRVESALTRGEVDAACQILSQVHPSPESALADLGARAHALQAYERWDKPMRAIGSLEKALEWAPESAELRRLHGALLRRSGANKRAAAELAEARRLAPGDPRIAYEALLTRLAAGERGGDLLEFAGAVEGRAAAFMAIASGDLAAADRAVAPSARPLDLLVHSVLLLAQGEVAGALADLERVTAETRLPRPIQAFAGLYLGIARMQRRRLVPAAEALESARAHGAPEPEVQRYLAWVYQQLAVDALLERDPAAASGWFERLGKLNAPESAAARGNAAHALGLLGQEQARKGDYDGAAVSWSRALEIAPGDAVLRQNLAVALERAGRAEEAIPHWHELVRQIPREAGAARRTEGGVFPEEVELTRHLRAGAHRHLADLYVERHDTKRAIDQLEKAVRIMPDDLDTRRNLASLLMDEGEARKAVTHYRQVVVAAPESVQDHLELGLALQAAGEEQRGIEQLDRALELQPDNSLVRSSLGLALTRRATRSPGAATALDDAQRSVELLPPSYVALGLIALGAGQLEHGDRKTAQKSFKLAIRKAPLKAVTAARIGDVYWRADDREAALATWSDGMKRAKRSPAAYPDLAESFAVAGETDRFREALEAALERPWLWPAMVGTVERISRSRKLQPILRETLRSMAESAPGPVSRLLLVRMLVFAGDAQGAGSLLSRMALEAVEAGNDLFITPILDLDMRYRLLDRRATRTLADWLDARGYWDEPER